MSWAEYEPPTTRVPLSNKQSGIVRGLNLDDMTILVTNHLEPISRAVALYAQSKNDVYSQDHLFQFITLVVQQFPGLVTEIIALAADEPSLRDKKIAAGDQIAALDAIGRLTLEGAGGLGNLSATLLNLAKGALSEYPTMRESLQGMMPAEQKSRSSIGGVGKK